MPRGKLKLGKFLLYLILAGGVLAAVVLMKGNLDIRSRAFYTVPTIAPHEPTVAPTFQPRRTFSPRFSPTPSPTPVPPFCGSVTVTGATYAGIVFGKPRYYLNSGASATLKANVVPSNTAVNWKANQSTGLPNGGTFSVNYAPTTVYTAPINTSGAEQGVEIRGDISEYPKPWLYCPPMTFVVRPK